MIGARLEAMLDGGPEFEPGSVWLVGAGPGDPGYLTVNAVRALHRADTILHDALIDDRILDLARPEAHRIFSGKRAGVHSIDQTALCARMVDLARSGQRVLRLKGGRPMPTRPTGRRSPGWGSRWCSTWHCGGSTGSPRP